MTELWLKFRNEKGENQRVLVEGKNFIIGRQAGNDLSIPDSRLSRQHVKIESFAGIFDVLDCGSSNGTTLNGSVVSGPIALKDGDILNLGGGVEIAVEIIYGQPPVKRSNYENDSDEELSGNPTFSGGTGGQTSATSASNSSAIPTGVFVIAPILGIAAVICGGGLLYFLGGNDAGKSNEVSTSYSTPDETPEKTRNSPSPKPSSTIGNSTTGVTPSPEQTDTQPTPEITDEKKKIEVNSASFLQRIALNDPTAFLKSSEIQMVNSKLAAFKGSSNLAENLKSVKTHASKFKDLAEAKGLKPQFLAAAALTEIGNNKRDPLEAAQTMLPVLGKLQINLANNLADDCLMIIAAYDQGKAGKFDGLNDKLYGLGKRNPGVSPREIRTIWFLKKQGKITETEFEFALRFLAIGTIMQNPRQFNVNADAVTF